MSLTNMTSALAQCHKHLGDDATILYYWNLPTSIKKMVKKQEQKEGGPWKGNSAGNFYGWEANKIVAVTSGESVMELITRAQTCLCVILVEGVIFYEEIKNYFHQAADAGLIEMQNVDTDDSMWNSMWNRAKLLMKTGRKAV